MNSFLTILNLLYIVRNFVERTLIISTHKLCLPMVINGTFPSLFLPCLSYVALKQNREKDKIRKKNCKFVRIVHRVTGVIDHKKSLVTVKNPEW